MKERCGVPQHEKPSSDRALEKAAVENGRGLTSFPDISQQKSSNISKFFPVREKVVCSYGPLLPLWLPPFLRRLLRSKTITNRNVYSALEPLGGLS